MNWRGVALTLSQNLSQFELRGSGIEPL